MMLCKRAAELHACLETTAKTGRETGFIPTMGALHAGHISLLQASKNKGCTTVCSIFVNPTQFNDPADFRKYPVTIEKDIYLLEKNAVDILFLPSVAEIYPDGTGELEHYELGYLENIFEGRYRPGHFQGVCQVMYRLLSLVKPDHLFMGQKDYQQCMVIKKMLSELFVNTTFHTCPTLREADGLAMSSRNMRLTEKERENAATIYKALSLIRNGIRPGDLTGIINQAKSLLDEHAFKTDYVEIAGSGNLEVIRDWDGQLPVIALVAAFQHEIRLIDNMIL